ncbi:MAG: tail fiber domain-containing protein [Saprospiraceae bacterium]
MNKFILNFVVSIYFIAATVIDINAQSVAINTDGSVADPSAILDVKSNTKGVLIPRMTGAQRNGIQNPAEGLLVYDTGSSSFWYRKAAGWIELTNGSISGQGPWNVSGINIYNSNTGNVGLGSTNPTARLTIQTPINNTGWNHIGGKDSIIVSEGIGGISGSIGTATNHTFRLNSNGLGRLHIYNTGEVVVGDNSTPTFGKFTVETPNNNYGITHRSVEGNILATRIGGTSAGIGTFTPTNMRIFSNGASRIFIAEANGNVGIGTDLADPAFKLDIADRIRIRSGSTTSTAGLWLNNPSNSTAIAFMGIKDVDLAGIYGNNAGWGLLMNTNTGALSIGSQNPVAGYKFSVQGNQYLNGLIHSTGDAEIGGDAEISGNGLVSGDLTVGGRIVIGALKQNGQFDLPPLEVKSNVSYQSYTGWTYYDNVGIKFYPDELCIRAHGAVMADYYIAISDARVKNIIGVSNTSNDLETINALQITDYMMKDKIKNGNKVYKKIIAQQVEKVYPQVVSKNVGYIPNIYAIPSTVKKTSDGYLLTFKDKLNLSPSAKRIQIMNDRETKQVDIVSIPSDTQLVINTSDLKSDNVFVYGEEVNDFRAVDYEGLTTLNISATQELSKLIKKQQSTIDAQQHQITLLVHRLELLEKENIKTAAK